MYVPGYPSMRVSKRETLPAKKYTIADGHLTQPIYSYCNGANLENAAPSSVQLDHRF
jgi:hypothetical protein